VWRREVTAVTHDRFSFAARNAVNFCRAVSRTRGRFGLQSCRAAPLPSSYSARSACP
jgi:hypothetical protein